MMSKVEMTEAIILAKAEKSIGWCDIAAAAGLSEVYTTSACLGMNHLYYWVKILHRILLKWRCCL